MAKVGVTKQFIDNNKRKGTMEQQVFISHCSEDKAIAEVIADNIESLSNGFIKFWYSSDPRSMGGMEAGDIVFNKIVKCLNESVATIVLLTPRSINRPWIFFESGMAQGRETLGVIPVCVGIGKDSVVAPLNNYQYYQLSDMASLTDFVTKLLGKAGLKFDKSIHKEALQTLLSALQEQTQAFAQSNENKVPNMSELIDDLKNHITNSMQGLVAVGCYQGDAVFLPYTIQIRIGMGKNKGSLGYLEVKSDDTVQRILDKIYFLLNGQVKSYTYMESWVLRELNTSAYLIMYEVANLVPARYIFRPELKWEVVEWNEDAYQRSRSMFPAGLYPHRHRTGKV